MPGVPPAPVPSRVRDALAGGHRNLQADRDHAAMMEARFPGTAAAVADAAAFTARAVTWAARQGIAQYAVAGPLLLPGCPVREAARAVIPAARVTWACGPGDPSAVACARAEAARHPGTAVIAGDAGPAALLASPAAAAVVDWSAPACAVLAMTVHMMPPEAARDLAGDVAGLLAPGSCVIVSAAVPEPGPEGDALIAAAAACAPVWRHPPAVIGEWLEKAGLVVVPPGVTDVRGWRAGWAEPRLRARPPAAMMIAGAVARALG